MCFHLIASHGFLQRLAEEIVSTKETFCKFIQEKFGSTLTTFDTVHIEKIEEQTNSAYRGITFSNSEWSSVSSRYFTRQNYLIIVYSVTDKLKQITENYIQPYRKQIAQLHLFLEYPLGLKTNLLRLCWPPMYDECENYALMLYQSIMAKHCTLLELPSEAIC